MLTRTAEDLKLTRALAVDDGARPQETGRMDPHVATGVNILKVRA